MHLLIWLILSIKLVSGEDLKIQPLLVPSDLTEDRKVFLTCQTVKGERPFHYEWMFNDKSLVYDDNVHVHSPYEDLSILTINHLKYKNIGNYSCRVSDKFKTDSSSVLIEFKGKPIEWGQSIKTAIKRIYLITIFLSVVKPFWRSELTDQTVQLNKEVVLNCDTDGSPKPTTRFEKMSKYGKAVVWPNEISQKPWKLPKSSNSIIFVYFSSLETGGVSEKVYPNTKSLKLKVNRALAGYYRCVSSNELGKLEKMIQIKCYGKIVWLASLSGKVKRF